MNKQENTQNKYIDDLIEQKKPISIFLISGIRLNGCIIGQDRYTIHLDGKISQLIEKSSISTIMPEQNTNNKNPNKK